MVTIMKKDVTIRLVEPEIYGLMYRLKAETGLPNLAETLKFLLKNYYEEL